MLHARDLVCEFRRRFLILRECRFPCGAEIVSALAHYGSKVFPHAVRHQKLCIFWPAIDTLGAANFLFTQRLTMGFFGVLLFGGSISNVAVNDNKRRTILR